MFVKWTCFDNSNRRKFEEKMDQTFKTHGHGGRHIELFDFSPIGGDKGLTRLTYVRMRCSSLP